MRSRHAYGERLTVLALEYLKASFLALAPPLALAAPLASVDDLLVGALAVAEALGAFALRDAVETSPLISVSAIALRLGGICDLISETLDSIKINEL